MKFGRKFRQEDCLISVEHQAVDSYEAAHHARQEKLVFIVDHRTYFKGAISVDIGGEIIDEVSDPIGKKRNAEFISAKPTPGFPKADFLIVGLQLIEKS